jgi:hypothetical protein
MLYFTISVKLCIIESYTHFEKFTFKNYLVHISDLEIDFLILSPDMINPHVCDIDK